MTQGAYVRVSHDTVRIEADGATKFQVPKHHLGAIFCFGNVMVSSGLIRQCSADGRSLVFLDYSGRFRARMVGPTSGNVLLRQAQHEALSDDHKTLEIAKGIIASKIKNTRAVLMRGAREAKTETAETTLRNAAQGCNQTMKRLARSDNLNLVRGHEGDIAHSYFQSFAHLLRTNAGSFGFSGRNRRPPRDPVNALLSFLYALLTSDCVSALEGVGLDPQMGFLHAIRPGRPSLALDILEELRAPVADRLALTLINRKEVTVHDFDQEPGGAVGLNDTGRRKTVVAYQKRKAQEIRHRLLDRMIPVGLIPHVQARLLARHLRGDLEHYIPYTTVNR